MLALIQTILLALDIYWWLLIAAAIFSWLYAFNVVNARNPVVGTIGATARLKTVRLAGDAAAIVKALAAFRAPVATRSRP